MKRNNHPTIKTINSQLQNETWGECVCDVAECEACLVKGAATFTAEKEWYLLWVAYHLNGVSKYVAQKIISIEHHNNGKLLGVAMGKILA